MQLETPLFSIIIPSYNRSNELIVAVNSVIQQTFKNFEILVVDDGSTDDTLSKLASTFNDSRLKIHSITHAGRSKARNYGITNATGQWICFLDSDDEYLPNMLDLFHKYILRYPQYSAFACEQTFNYKPRNYLNKKHKSDNYIFTFNDFIEDNPVSLNQICYKSTLNNRFPNDDLENSEDWYFFRLLAYKTAIFKFNDVGVNVNDHNQRSIYTIDTSSFVHNNLKSTLLLIKELQLNGSERNKLLIFTYLLCANIILSKTRNKKEAFQYFKKAIKPRALFYLNFYRAIFKFIFF